LMSITCPTKAKCVVLDDKNNLIFADKNHLTDNGARYFGAKTVALIEQK